MPRLILVDGYNFLFAVGKGPHQADRTYLLHLLAAYKNRKHVDITAVFDRKTGNPAEGRQVLLQQGIKVIFSAPAQEADEIICQIVETSENPKDFLVVSSDKAGISKYCRKLGAEVMECRDFLLFLSKDAGRRAVSRLEERDDEKPQVLDKDIDYYLEKFTKKKK